MRRALALACAWALIGLLTALIVVGLCGSACAAPSVTIVLADDMRVDDVQYVPAIGALAARGTTFTGAIAPFPLCTPARVSLLTGKHVETHGLTENRIARADLSDTIATRVKQRGWRTGYVGKIGNRTYEMATRPPGWDTYFALQRHTDYGARQAHVLANRGADFLRSCKNDDVPCLLIVAPVLPHGGAGGPPECVGPWPPKPPSTIISVERWEFRMKALCGLEHVVEKISRVMPQDGTIIVTSDQGYAVEEFKQGKNEQLLDAHRMPLVVARPGAYVGARSEVVTLVDIARSIVEWAGASTAGMEGRSIEPLLQGGAERWINPVVLWSLP